MTCLYILYFNVHTALLIHIEISHDQLYIINEHYTISEVLLIHACLNRIIIYCLGEFKMYCTLISNWFWHNSNTQLLSNTITHRYIIVLITYVFCAIESGLPSKIAIPQIYHFFMHLQFTKVMYVNISCYLNNYNITRTYRIVIVVTISATSITIESNLFSHVNWTTHTHTHN